MPEFGPRGAELWKKLGQADEHTPGGVLAVEACRMVDRLDKLDAAGPDLFQEARLQAAALKALLESPVLKVEQPKGASGVDTLAARRAARRAAAAGS